MKLIPRLIKPITKSTLILSIATTILTGCGSDADIVREGTMKEYPQAAVGKVLENYFNNPEWKSIEMGGKTYITFNGKINQLLFAKAIEKNRPQLQHYVLSLLNNKNENDPIYKTFNSKNNEIYQNTIGGLETKAKGYSDFIKQRERLIKKEFAQLHSKDKATLEKIEALKKSIDVFWKNIDNRAYKLFDDDRVARSRGSLNISDEEFNKKHKSVVEAKTKSDEVRKQISTLEKSISMKEDVIRRDFLRRKNEALSFLKEYKNKLKKQAKDKYQKKYDELMESLASQFEKDYYWVPDSEVTFKWLVHANKKDFELIEATNDYWALYGETTKTIFDTIYAD